MAERQYHRLTWGRHRKSGFAGFTITRSSLWLGQDHLLGIDSTGYSESYKRFYFRDIQAVTIRLTSRRQIWNAVLGSTGVLCLGGWLLYLLSQGRPGLGETLATVGIMLFFGVPFLLNNLFGPTCVCHLHTAVQTEELPSLNRLPKTRRILNRLRPLIAQAQGQLAPEEIPTRVQAWTAAATAQVEYAAGVRPSSGAATSVSGAAAELPGAPDSAEPAALEDGRTPAAQPSSGPAEAKVRYVVDDPNLPPRIIS